MHYNAYIIFARKKTEHVPWCWLNLWTFLFLRILSTYGLSMSLIRMLYLELVWMMDLQDRFPRIFPSWVTSERGGWIRWCREACARASSTRGNPKSRSRHCTLTQKGSLRPILRFTVADWNVGRFVVRFCWSLNWQKLGPMSPVQGHRLDR